MPEVSRVDSSPDLHGRPSPGRLAATLGMDLGAFAALKTSGVPLLVSHLGAFAAGALVFYGLEAVRLRRFAAWGIRELGFSLFLALLALSLRGGVLVSLIGVFGVPLAAIGAAVATALVNSVGSALFLVRRSQPPESPESWNVRLLAVIGYAVLLRLCYMGSVELLYEEAYYWNYGQHLDLAYYDHPPLVGWLIRLSTTLFGDNEFGLRMGPFVCWIVAAAYVHKLAQVIFDQRTARFALLVCAVLPVYFILGLVMIPDTPLLACWAAAVYYLYRALIEERGAAWIGVGIAMGLGLLAKYTAALLGPAVLLFVLLDRRSRPWLLRPHPYLAVAVAVLLFLPVVIWNASNEWASFAFQSVGRVTGNYDFDLPDLVGTFLLQLTPTGLVIFCVVLWTRRFRSGGEKARRTSLLLLIVSLTPLAVFLAFSLFRDIKLHWTAPVWLSVVPYMAAVVMPKASSASAGRPSTVARRIWPATVGAVLLIYGIKLHYLALGIPGIPYFKGWVGLGMQDLAVQVEDLALEHERTAGDVPLVVGADTHRLAGWIAFYRVKRGLVSREKALRATGEHLFAGDSKMYSRWFSAEAEAGRTLLVVGKDPWDVAGPRVEDRALRLGDIRKLTARRQGKPVGVYYCRFLYGYKPPPPRNP